VETIDTADKIEKEEQGRNDLASRDGHLRQMPHKVQAYPACFEDFAHFCRGRGVGGKAKKTVVS
jgi:hypothetical protein